MTYDRYYYSVLSESDKLIYKKIYEGITEFKSDISFKRLPGATVPPEKILSYIGLDNPHIFYVDFNFCRIGKTLFGETIQLTYWYKKSQAEEINKKLNTVLQKMLVRASGKTDYEKELSVHNLLVENTDYDFSALENPHAHSPRANSVLGIAFYKTAVCEGVAKIFKLLLNMLDIKCIVATGTEARQNVPHAWNIVKISGKAYHIDVTWDIGARDTGGYYDYFNLTDADISKDHTPEIKYPICDSYKDNYFGRNGLVINNPTDAKMKIFNAKNSGKESISLKLNCNSAEFMNCVNDVVQIAQRVLLKGVHYTYNTEQQTVTVSL